MAPVIAAVAFPPPAPPSVSLPSTYAVMLTLTGILALLLLIRGSRPVKRWDSLIWVCMAIGVVGVFLCSPPLIFLVDRALRGVLFVFIAAAALIGANYSLHRSRPPESSANANNPGYLALGGLLFYLLLAPSCIEDRPRRRPVCNNNLRELGLAMHNYADKYHDLPAPVTNSESTPRSWRIDVLPWLGDDSRTLRSSYQDASSWDSTANEPIAKSAVRVFQCPQNFNPQDNRGRFYTSYVALTGEGAMFSDPVRTNFAEGVTDGTSNTLMLVEACGQQIVWTEPRDVDVAGSPIGINLDGDAVGQSPGVASSYHPTGCNVLFGDGSVKFLEKKIDREVLKALITANGNERIDHSEY
jgi:prepilin-type processing-associated H-X9-DG protein